MRTQTSEKKKSPLFCHPSTANFKTINCQIYLLIVKCSKLLRMFLTCSLNTLQRSPLGHQKKVSSRYTESIINQLEVLSLIMVLLFGIQCQRNYALLQPHLLLKANWRHISLVFSQLLIFGHLLILHDFITSYLYTVCRCNIHYVYFYFKSL